MQFKTVIPAYNCEEWIARAIDSTKGDVIVVDDCSTDSTWDIICSYKIEKIRNNKRIGSGLANIIKGIDLISDNEDDIIVTLDGDDYLTGDAYDVLSEAYKEDIWMTYGSFLPLSGKFKNTCWPLDCARYVQEIGIYAYANLTPATYRKSGLWVTSHLRTFKRWLFDMIKDEDLRDIDGEYYKVAWDYAFMYPMIEMAGKHVKYIDKVIYKYNDLNPNCDGKIKTDEQVRIGKMIQEKECYGELDGHIL